MCVDQTAKWAFISAVLLLDMALVNFCHFQFQWHDLLAPALCSVILTIAIGYHSRKGNDKLTLCCVSLLLLGCYSVVFSPMMYMGCALNLPLVDPWLQMVDQWVGFSPVAVVSWTRKHAWIDFWSTWLYMFIVPETLIAVIATALSGDRQRLQEFITQFMLGTFVCGLFTIFIPAYGPLAHESISPAPWQIPFVEHFHQLRSGQLFRFSWQTTEGLVTFPSFHTAWALFLIVLWRGRTAWIYVPMSIISVLIVASTLTTGSHYLLDLFGGMALAWGCIVASRRWSSFVEKHPSLSVGWSWQLSAIEKLQ